MINAAASEEICETLNMCYVQSSIDPSWPAYPTAEQTQKAALSSETSGQEARDSATPRAGTITIAQITDVHFEFNYTEVMLTFMTLGGMLVLKLKVMEIISCAVCIKLQ